MNKPLALALLGVGIALIIWGINAGNSAGSEISKVFSGTPTDKSMWLLIGGIAATTVGAVFTFRSSTKS